uniref:Uncharacterized protein n=1 Tax=Loxodonta africana TaxID=9785 RepID=G3UAV2_LOXAF
QANHRKNRADFVEGIWREFLDPFDGDSEDSPGHSDYSANGCSLVTCNVTSQTPKSKSPEGVTLGDSVTSRCSDPLLQAASWIPAALEILDVDMQPVSEPMLPELQDSRMTEDQGPGAAGPFCNHVGPLGPGRPGESRAKGSRLPPRLGNERDKGPRFSVFKRKLELLLAEPEKNKRKKQ